MVKDDEDLEAIIDYYEGEGAGDEILDIDL